MRSDPPGFFVTTLAPSLGVVLSNVLYLAPLPAVRKAQRHMQLQGLNPIPLALMALNTVGFLAYGLAVPNRYVVASNVLGIVLAVWYLATVLPLVRDEPSLQQLKLVLVGGASFLVLEITWATLFLAEEKERAGVLGANATAVCVLMFAAPLSTLSEVCRTRSSSTIYGPLTTAQVCNCFLWTVYGAAVGDVWVTGPNSIGLLLGLVQAALLAILPSTSASAVTPEEGKAILSDMEVGAFGQAAAPKQA